MRPKASSPAPVSSDATAARPILRRPFRTRQPWSTSPSTASDVTCDVVEGETGGVVAVDHDGALDGEPLGLRIDEEQGEPVALARAAGGARRDDEEFGDVAVDHEALAAGEREPVARAGRLEGNFLRPMLGGLVDRQRGDEVAGDDLRQEFLLLRFRPRRGSAPRRASTAVAKKGDGVNVRPISSMTTPAST